MSKIRHGNFFAPNPDTYVSAALKTVFIEKRTVGIFSHKLQVCYCATRLIGLYECMNFIWFVLTGVRVWMPARMAPQLRYVLNPQLGSSARHEEGAEEELILCS